MTLPRYYATCYECGLTVEAPKGFAWNTETVLCSDCYTKKYGDDEDEM